MLAALSLTLMLVAGATVDALIAFYAIGVFTGFAMAGFGMARYHLRTREAGWRRRLVINTAGGVYTALVVVLFAVVKFTEGAWLIVIIFPVPGADPIGSLHQPGRAVVQGRLRAAQVRPVQQNNILACEVTDSTGELTAVFYGRSSITGLEPGTQVRLRGMVGIGSDGRPAMVNPAYELL